MTFTVLVVCSANICRSPLAALLLRHSLRTAGLDGDLRVLDCGDAAVPGLPACLTAQRWVADQGLPVDDLARHRSTPLDGALIRTADLVLAADRTNRAAVVSQRPDAVGRTFTVREAAELAVGVSGRVGGLDELVPALNDSRGLRGLAAPSTIRPGGRPWRRIEVHGHDLPDAHRGPDIAHAAVRRHLLPATEQLVETFRRVARPA